MQVNRLSNTSNLSYTRTVNNDSSYKRDKQINCDVFEKSSGVSFKGGFFDNLFADVFSNLIDGVSSVLRHHKREIQVGTFVDALSAKSVKQWFQVNKSTKIQDIIEDLYGNSAFLETGFMVKLFENAGINNGAALSRFVQVYSSRPEVRKVFRNQEMEAVEIYGMLRSKDDLAKYSDLLLYLYNYNKDTDKKNNIDIGELLDFLKKLNIYDFKDFEPRFAHLKGDFNNFDTIADKVDAIIYLQSTYDDKIRFIDEIVQNNSALKSKHSDRIYNTQSDVIDYLYEKNSGKSLEPLSLIIDGISAMDKVKSSVLKNLAVYFNGFDTPEDKIDFQLFLRNKKVSVTELNALAGNSIISDDEKLDNILNKEQFVREIAALTDGKTENANNTYKNFSDVFNALYRRGRADVSSTKKVLELIQRYNLKNSSAMLSLYNSIYASKNKNISAEELENFVDLMELCPSGDILKQARVMKKTPASILEQERDRYLEVKSQIEAFVLTDESDYFTGKTPEDIYKEYRESLNGCDDVSSVLQNIAKFNIADSQEYNNKAEKIDQLERYFADRKAFLDFINANNIKFDSSPEDDETISNCIKLFSSLDTQEQIDYYTQSGFVQNSQNVLSKFFRRHSDEAYRKEILSVIAEKKIPSMDVFNNFMQKYSSQDGSYQNVLKQLAMLPKDIDFEKYAATLKLLQDKLDRLNIPQKINNDNISKINISELYGKNKISVASLTLLINDLLSAKDGYIFISALPSAKGAKENTYSRFQIAVEYANKVVKSDESYSNITEKLKLDRRSLGLKDDCSDYLYIRALEHALPDEFVDFVNSNSWISDNDDNIPNLSLHARLRMIDRFGLKKGSDISELYTADTQNRLKDILNSIYTQTPESIRGSDKTKRIILCTNYDNMPIETVFAQNGKMITIVPKSF